MKRIISLTGLVAMGVLAVGCGPRAGDASRFYTQEGSDPPWHQVKAGGQLTIGENSTTGYTGSKITVNRKRVQVGPNAENPIPQDLRIHTLGHSFIAREDFAKWSRWYQEDGNVQIFRLFAGETNVRNSRPGAARIESFGGPQFAEGQTWYEWSGTYTIIKPIGACLLQDKNNKNDWGVMIGMNAEGDVIMNRRRGEDVTMAKNMVGKPFHLRVLCNGRDYHVLFDHQYIGGGTWARPEGRTGFRWGMYVGKNTPKTDGMVFVTGATIRELDQLPAECRAKGAGRS